MTTRVGAASEIESDHAIKDSASRTQRRGSWRDDEDMGSTWYLCTQQKLIAVFDQSLNFAGQNILHPPSIDRSDGEIRMVIDLYTARLQVQRLLITFQTWY